MVTDTLQRLRAAMGRELQRLGIKDTFKNRERIIGQILSADPTTLDGDRKVIGDIISNRA